MYKEKRRYPHVKEKHNLSSYDSKSMLALFFSLVVLGVTLVTSDTLRVCAIQRSLARGHDKSCDPLHGTKMRLILKEGDALRIRD
jgi:hypothetical protein